MDGTTQPPRYSPAASVGGPSNGSEPEFAGFSALVEEWRKRITAHWEAERPGEELPLIYKAPADKTDFAVVGNLPKRADAATYYTCSFCEREFQFGNDGRIVLSQGDLRLRLIGPDCHARHFEQNRWQAALDDHHAYQRRTKFNSLRSQIGPLLGTFPGAIRQVLREYRTLLESIATLPIAITAVATPLVSQFRAASLAGGALRTFNETEEPTLFQQAGGRSFGGRADFRTIHVARGLRPLLNALHPAEDLRQALARVEEAKHVIDETNWLSVSNLKADRAIGLVRRALSTAVTHLKNAASAIGETRLFFEPANIDGIVRWANDNDSPMWVQQRSMKAVTGGFVWEPDYGDPARIIAPPKLWEIVLPDTTELERLVAVL